MNKYKKVKIYIGDTFYNEFELKIINDTTLSYKDECTNTIEFKNDTIILVREDSEFKMIIPSNEESARYILKELNYELDIKINYFDLIKENDKLVIHYQIETNDKEIKLVLEGE